MMEDERRTLQEMKARYELEPTLQDVFVEGLFDQEALTRCFSNADNLTRIFYEIGSVDVPDDLLKQSGLTIGNKQRVIALSRFLATQSIGNACRCLVDRDLDHWFGELEQTHHLVWLPYCALELFFFSDELLQELLVVVAQSKISDWNAFKVSLVSTLSDLYGMRLADRELKWTMQWIAPDRCMALNGGSIEFAFDEYINRVLMKNGRMKVRKEFDESFSKWRSRLIGDPRNFIRGHDLMDSLAWSIRELRGLKAFSTVETLERLLVLLAPKATELLLLF